MAHSDSKSGSRGRVVLWIALVVLLVLATFATIFAVRNNPLYDEQFPGISRFKFIEECKEEVLATIRPQIAQAGLPAESVSLDFEAPARRVESVAYVPETGWVWSGGLLVRSPAGAGTFPFTCVWNEDEHEVQLVGPTQ